MDLHLDLSPDQVSYLDQLGLVCPLQDALQTIAEEHPPDPLLTLSELLGKVEGSDRTLVEGYPVVCCKNVELGVGPVVGEVTHQKAIIMIEVKNSKQHITEVTCDIYLAGSNANYLSQTANCHFTIPTAFIFEELDPNSEFVAVFSGINRVDAKRAYVKFRTKPEPEQMKSFKILAFSCDRPDQLLLGQKNPWYELAKKSYHADVSLHLGDQVYAKGEDIETTMAIFDETFENLPEEKQKKMERRGRALMRKKYRHTWNWKKTRETLQRGSHLMIWSDNDIANDFTVLKNENGDQAYSPAYLRCGIEVYRQYQRILWDPTGAFDLPDDPEQYFEEYHSHTYGPVGIFLFDMRGNRITSNGVQHSTNPIMSEGQWNELQMLFDNPDIKVLILAAEIPFVGDGAEEIKEKAKNITFLEDHWPYNTEDLVRILDMSFDWKEKDEDGREVLMIGGDIHCGVRSIITDKDSGLTINHITTSPITNHTCPFFPSLHGSINERYTYDHLPLGIKQRNYAEIMITLEPELSVISQLKPVSTDMYKVTEWLSDESDSDQE